jgi:carbon starvation protein
LKTGKRLFLLFVWFFSILAAAAFADIVRGTFAGFDAEGARITANASVAATSMLFIAAAVVPGFFIRRVKPNGIISAIAGIGLLVVCISLGLLFPLYLSKDVWLSIVFACILQLPLRRFGDCSSPGIISIPSCW